MPTTPHPPAPHYPSSHPFGSQQIASATWPILFLLLLTLPPPPPSPAVRGSGRRFRPTDSRQKGYQDDGEGVLPPVKRHRAAYTVVTSVWGNGDLGPVCIHFAASANVPNDLIKRVNEEFNNRLWVTVSRRDNHFMSADATVDYWEHCLSPAFRARRAALNMSDDSEVGALLFDKFGGNEATSKGYATRRDLWCKRNNVVALEPIIGGGGGSAKGQPCDGAHAYFRQLTDAAEDHCLQQGTDPLARRMLDDIFMGKFGSYQRELTPEQAVQPTSR